ncbi:MAG: nitrous oxide reductase family maturation protein NosD [Flavobacteriales bacterium]|nr:nitrous oxide reductase family maturation protein NosD [Flavobacteriales bacterium]
MGKVLAILLSWLLLPTMAWAGHHTFHSGQGRTLKDLLETIAPGDTVLVHGEVREGTITIRKPVTLIAADGAMIDGEGEGDVLVVRADDVTIRGFRIRGTRISHMDDLAAISVQECRRITIADNHIEESFFAIHLNGAHDAVIEGNRVAGRPGSEESMANGIHLWKSSRATIRNNHVMHHRDGIYLEFVSDARITDNTVLHCERYGLHFMFSHGNLYAHNHFEDNGAGVAVMYSRDIHMRQNRFLANRGASAYGLLLKDINDGTIENNTFMDNTTGILVDGCNRLRFEDNLFRLNGWALRMYASSMHCDLEGNVFSGNTFDVSTNGSLAYNRMEGNYWDRYTGYDLDRDGHGDVPHRPLGFFTLLVERMPYALVFSRSLFVSLLDRAERLVPSLTPEDLKDDRPLMRPNPTAGHGGAGEHAGDPPENEDNKGPNAVAALFSPFRETSLAHG